jgi:alginate O-acetyltransferase complex protein AlgI
MKFLCIASLIFIVFLLLFYCVKNKFKIYILLISSILFISVLSVNVAIFSLLFAALNYFIGIALDKFRSNQNLKTNIFWLGIFLNIAILGSFKYLNVFFGSMDSKFFDSGIYSLVPSMSIMVPIGISYYTFQSLGYLIRVSRGNENAERNFATYATYLLFFPKFLSGPVSRSNQFLPQLNNPAKYDKNNVETGSRLLLWGLFKKMVIADNLFGPVSDVYNNVHQFSGLALITVLFIQTIYIYADFSGYTDMALGVAKMFGINLVDNFNRPFLAKNISEFWRRWHISLSSWCNDFIYNPFIIKYRRFGNRAVIAGIFLTFFIVGIWHGANWTFVVLGILQGIAIVYEFHTKKYRLKFAARFSKSTVTMLSRLVVFIFMSVSMVFFFSKSVSDALYFISHLFSNSSLHNADENLISNKMEFSVAIFAFSILFYIELLNERGKNLMVLFLKQPLWLRWICYLAIVALIGIFYSGFNTFYYMRF